MNNDDDRWIAELIRVRDRLEAELNDTETKFRKPAETPQPVVGRWSLYRRRQGLRFTLYAVIVLLLITALLLAVANLVRHHRVATSVAIGLTAVTATLVPLIVIAPHGGTVHQQTALPGLPSPQTLAPTPQPNPPTPLRAQPPVQQPQAIPVTLGHTPTQETASATPPPPGTAEPTTPPSNTNTGQPPTPPSQPSSPQQPPGQQPPQQPPGGPSPKPQRHCLALQPDIQLRLGTCVTTVVGLLADVTNGQ